VKDITVLVVDDNPTNLKLLKVLLSVEGYKILTATEAQETKIILQTELPDIILMDIQLPGMDGLTLTQWIKEQPQYQHIKVIALTSYAMKGDKEKALKAGCDGYISKPIDGKELPKIIENYLHT
jgi:CheY-like chemotaxis protein